MYNKKENNFFDKVDGTIDASRPGWGNNIGDGWAKLARHNRKTKKVLNKFSKNNLEVKKYDQELQFKTELNL